MVVLASIAYLALPSGRMCLRCGVPTSSVVLEAWWQRPASRWLDWRWCSRCGWEGVGRRGPDVGLKDPPVDHESGFRWGRPKSEQVPIFHWRDGAEHPPDHPAGFRWSNAAEEERPSESNEPAEPTGEGTADHASGFRWGSPGEEAPFFLWGLGARGGREPKPVPSPRPAVPWYLSWLPPKKSSGFRWKPEDH